MYNLGNALRFDPESDLLSGEEYEIVWLSRKETALSALLRFQHLSRKPEK